MNKAVKYGIIATASTGLILLSRYMYKQIQEAKNWDFLMGKSYFGSIKLVNNKPVLKGSVEINFINKSDFKATIKDMDIQVFSKDIRIGSIQKPQVITILPKNSTLLVFDLTLDTNEIVDKWNVLLGTALTSKNIPLDFVGQFKVKMPWGFMKVPVKYSTTGKDLKKMYDTYYG